MRSNICSCEDELLDAMARGYIPSELQMHVDGCASCSELHLVAGALLDDRREAVAEAPVPSAGAMWCRMQVRLRHEAQTASRRSLMVGQAMTLAVAIFFTATLFGADFMVEVRQVASIISWSSPVFIAIASWLLLAPIAGYVAVRQK